MHLLLLALAARLIRAKIPSSVFCGTGSDPVCPSITYLWNLEGKKLLFQRG
jgi:hypothetical protein